MKNHQSQKPPNSKDDPEQSKRFIEAAKDAGADETEEGANRAFKKAAVRKMGKARPEEAKPRKAK